MNILEIKTDADKITVAAILVANGYTVRIATVKDGNKPKKVLMYENEKIKKEK